MSAAARNTRERILQAATRLMLARGLRKVTMDEIAGEVGISKKTLYQEFSSKDELVHALADGELEQWAERRAALIDAHPDVVDLLHALARYAIEAHRRFGAEIRRDLQADYPDIWRRLQERRERNLLEMEGLIERGIAQGKLKNLHPHVAALALRGAMQAVTDPDVIAEQPFTADEAAADVYELFLHGLLTETGAARLGRVT